MRVHALLEVAPAHRARLERAAPGIGLGFPLPDGLDVLVAGFPSDAELGRVRPGGRLVIPFSGGPPTARRPRICASPRWPPCSRRRLTADGSS